MASTLNKLGISALRGAYRIRPRLPCRPLVSQPCPFHTSSTRRNTGAPPPTKPSTIIDSQDVPDELDEDLVYNTQRAPRNAEEEAMLRRAEEQLTPEEKALLDQWKAKGEANAATAADRFLAEMGDDPPEAHEHFRPGLMAMGEVDEVDVGEDETFKGDDMTSLGHAELDQHREMREYARIAAWEMPLLSSTPLSPPSLPPSLHLAHRLRGSG
jgi:small subunit ribosomal protein S35